MSEQSPKPDGRLAARTSPLRMLLPALTILAVAGIAALVLLGGSSKPALPNGASQAPAGSGYFGTLALPSKQAPPIALRNYLGQPVTLAEYRGRAVLVTFLYANCPDVCPLIASNLRVALNLMGPKNAAKVRVIAVSVDPRGDTPKAVAAFLARHGMTGRMQYLVGSAKELAGVWKAWGVGSERDAQQPQLVNHTGLVYGITGKGLRLTLYASSFQPAEIAHDVPLLVAR